MAKENPEQRLSRAIAEGDADVIKQLLADDVINVNRRDVTHDMQTLLMRLCHVDLPEHAQQELVEALEDAGADTDATDSLGRTPLMHACIARQPRIARFLLSRDCDVSKRDRTRDNCLHHAVRSGSEEIVREILDLEEGRQLVLEKNNAGVSPLDVCGQQGAASLASLLQSCLGDGDSPHPPLSSPDSAPPSSPRKLPPTFPHPSCSQSPAPPKGNARSKGRNSCRSECDVTVGRSADAASPPWGKGGNSTQGRQLPAQPPQDRRLMVLRSMSDGVDQTLRGLRTSAEVTSQEFQDLRGLAAKGALTRGTLLRQSSDHVYTLQRGDDSYRSQRGDNLCMPQRGDADESRTAEERRGNRSGDLFPKIDSRQAREPQSQGDHGARRDSISLPDLRSLKSLVDGRGGKNKGSSLAKDGQQGEEGKEGGSGKARKKEGVKFPSISSVGSNMDKGGQAKHKRLSRKLSSSDDAIYTS